MEERRMESWVHTSLDGRGYKVKKLIGTGSFGRVYLVEKLQTGVIWACKSASTMQARQLLRKEGEMLYQIHHPVFPRFEQLVEEQQGCLLLMEYVEGESLAEKLERGALLQKEALDYVIQLAEGIRYLHEFSVPVLYRDLKPENVKVGSDGKVRLLDLGCACELTQVRFSKAGSRGYAPPEQLQEGQAGLYSDVYALGRLLYYMLTGEKPCRSFVEESGLYVSGKQVSPYLINFIEYCTKENYRERIQDMNSVIQNLRRIGRDEKFIYETIKKN